MFLQLNVFGPVQITLDRTKNSFIRNILTELVPSAKIPARLDQNVFAVEFLGIL